MRHLVAVCGCTSSAFAVALRPLSELYATRCIATNGRTRVFFPCRTLKCKPRTRDAEVLPLSRKIPHLRKAPNAAFNSSFESFALTGFSWRARASRMREAARHASVRVRSDGFAGIRAVHLEGRTFKGLDVRGAMARTAIALGPLGTGDAGASRACAVALPGARGTTGNIPTSHSASSMGHGIIRADLKAFCALNVDDRTQSFETKWLRAICE